MMKLKEIVLQLKKPVPPSCISTKEFKGVKIKYIRWTELLKCNSFGDPSSNAEAMCMRRCCAKFGIGRFLWEN